MKRSLSSDVGTRWYQAPEICMVEPKYDQASDMWSLGCILYELLQSIQKPPHDTQQVVPFLGASCYHISSNETETNDQLQVIIQNLDDINEDDFSFITQKEVKGHVQKLLQGKAYDCQNYKNTLKCVDISQEMREILDSLLQFNPYFRLSASELLENQYFDDIRNIKQEKSTKLKINLEVDESGAGDDIFTLTNLKKLILEEHVLSR